MQHWYRARLNSFEIKTHTMMQARTLLAMKAKPIRHIWMYNAGATNIQAAAAEAGITIQGRYIEERQEWRTHPFDRNQPDPHLETIENLEATIEPSEEVDWIIAQDGHEPENDSETTHQFQQLTRLIDVGESHGGKAIIIFTRPTSKTHHHNDDRSSIAQRMQILEHGGWNTLRADIYANRYGAAVATKFTIIVATKSIHTLRTFHLQRANAEPIQRSINDEAEQWDPQITRTQEIRDMQRPRSEPETTIDTNEPRIAAMIQRKGQGTNDRDWVTAWTPCYDVDHPGPDLYDTSNQWFESPFAVETTDHRQ